jgi:hypothetical protein
MSTVDLSLANKVITRTVLEGFRARGENWQALTIHDSFSREIIVDGRPSLETSKAVSYTDAIEKMWKSNKLCPKETFFVLEHENFFTTKSSICATSKALQTTSVEFDAIVHSFKLTPVQILPKEGDPEIATCVG